MTSSSSCGVRRPPVIRLNGVSQGRISRSPGSAEPAEWRAGRRAAAAARRRQRAGRPEAEVDLRVVGERRRPTPGDVGDDGDAGAPEGVGRADPGQQEQVR